MISEKFNSINNFLSKDNSKTLPVLFNEDLLNDVIKREEFILNKIEGTEEKIYALKNMDLSSYISNEQKNSLIKFLMRSLENIDNKFIHMSYVNNESSLYLLNEIEEKIHQLNSRISIINNFITQTNDQEELC